ncbi:hypothetical protein BC629DRAFT_1529328, partial [Irpex lacteus]
MAPSRHRESRRQSHLQYVSRAITIYATGRRTLTGVLGSGVIVPLYIDPAGTSCSAWTPLLDAISAILTPFYVIINPNSGPVTTPDDGYQTCIPRLKAHQHLNGGNGYVILNPGGSVGSETAYFNIANQIVTAENFYDDFSPSQLSFSSSAPAAQQAVILTDAPSTPPASLISQLVGTDKIGSLYITDDSQANGANPYDTLPTQFATFVAD